MCWVGRSIWTLGHFSPSPPALALAGRGARDREQGWGCISACEREGDCVSERGCDGGKGRGERETRGRERSREARVGSEGS